jgi:hypothetical protein
VRGEPCGRRRGRCRTCGAEDRTTSRLDSFIRRLEAQRACLDLAVRLVDGLDGPVLELGLGSGRTFDHLRRRLPDREIFVFERTPDPRLPAGPDEAHLIRGDLVETLRAARDRLPRLAVLAHSDIGTGDPERNARIARRIAALLPALLQPGGIVASDQPLASDRLDSLQLPRSVRPGRYHLYRCAGCRDGVPKPWAVLAA